MVSGVSFFFFFVGGGGGGGGGGVRGLRVIRSAGVFGGSYQNPGLYTI